MTTSALYHGPVWTFRPGGVFFANEGDGARPPRRYQLTQTTQNMQNFNQKAESALNDEFGHDNRTFEHDSDVEFKINSRDHGIPGEPERPGAYAVQLMPEGELDDGEAGFFGHTVEVDGETLQVNWLW